MGRPGRRPAAASPLLDAAVGEAAAAGAQYADVRLSETQELRLYAVSGRAPDERVEGSLGLGVRVLVDGVWGFASRAAARGRRRRAGRPAGGAQRPRGRGRVAGAGRAPAPAAESGRYQTLARVDPFAVSAAVRERVVAGRAGRGRARRPGWCGRRPGSTPSASTGTSPSTEGSRQEQHFVESGGMVLAVAAGEHLVQRRSYPNSFHGNTAGGGLGVRRGPAAAAGGGPGRRGGGPAAHRPGGRAGHRSTRHRPGPARAADPRVDRARARAGPDPRRRGQLRRPLVHRAATPPARCGTARRRSTSWPTRPCPAPGAASCSTTRAPAPARTMLITEGDRAPTSCPAATARPGSGLGRPARPAPTAGASCRCASRPTCSWSPASGSLDELLDRMGDGYYLDDNQSWSIDSQRLNFQFGTEVAWEVRGGRQRPAAPRLLLRRDHPAVLGIGGGRGRAGRVPHVRHAVRQGRAQGVGLPVPRRRARAVPRRRGSGWPDGRV